MTEVLVRDAAMWEATVRSAATGDQVAFARLVAEHHASMARVAFVVCGDVEMANDATQAAWVSAWQRMASLRQPTHVRAWLIAIAANEARKAMSRRRRVTVVDISGEVARAEGGDPYESLDLVDLTRALRDLRPEDRSLLAMRFLAGLDSSEIAPHLGISASGVRTRLTRILDRLRVGLALPPENVR